MFSSLVSFTRFGAFGMFAVPGHVPRGVFINLTLRVIVEGPISTNVHNGNQIHTSGGTSSLYHPDCMDPVARKRLNLISLLAFYRRQPSPRLARKSRRAYKSRASISRS